MIFNLKRMLALLMLTMLPFAVLAEAADAYETIYFLDGSKVRIPASIAQDAQALSDYCSTYFPGRVYAKDEGSLEPTDTLISAAWTQAQYGEGSRAMGVWLVSVGWRESVVKTMDSELTVPNQYLSFGANQDAKHQVAYVYAPRSGEATLREKAASNGAKVATCKTGRIVAVQEYNGSTYTKIRYDDVEGYIRTDCLIFPVNNDTALGTATLHVNGQTDGKDTVALYAEASAKVAKVGSWLTGTNVTVHDVSGEWYVVEVEGWIGYVQAKCLKMNEE